MIPQKLFSRISMLSFPPIGLGTLAAAAKSLLRLLSPIVRTSRLSGSVQPQCIRHAGQLYHGRIRTLSQAGTADTLLKVGRRKRELLWGRKLAGLFANGAPSHGWRPRSPPLPSLLIYPLLPSGTVMTPLGLLLLPFRSAHWHCLVEATDALWALRFD